MTRRIRPMDAQRLGFFEANRPPWEPNRAVERITQAMGVCGNDDVDRRVPRHWQSVGLQRGDTREPAADANGPDGGLDSIGHRVPALTDAEDAFRREGSADLRVGAAHSQQVPAAAETTTGSDDALDKQHPLIVDDPAAAMGNAGRSGGSSVGLASGEGESLARTRAIRRSTLSLGRSPPKTKERAGASRPKLDASDDCALRSFVFSKERNTTTLRKAADTQTRPIDPHTDGRADGRTLPRPPATPPRSRARVRPTRRGRRRVRPRSRKPTRRVRSRRRTPPRTA